MMSEPCEDDRMHDSYTCCICGSEGDEREMFGLSLYPMSDFDQLQQWYVHPKCIRDAMHPVALSAAMREELAAMMWTGDERKP